jgi:hypothetical protein
MPAGLCAPPSGRVESHALGGEEMLGVAGEDPHAAAAPLEQLPDLVEALALSAGRIRGVEPD